MKNSLLAKAGLAVMFISGVMGLYTNVMQPQPLDYVQAVWSAFLIMGSILLLRWVTKQEK
jgi:prepilin signal peptidase PulO-like enzyme (type II secretory pathway)